MKLLNFNFLAELLEFRSISSHCSSISSFDEKITLPKSKSTTILDKHSLVLYTNVPYYFALEFASNPSLILQKTIRTYLGHYIDFTSSKNAEDFVRSKISAQRYSKLKTYSRRLESCFQIRYVYYHGEIDSPAYENAFLALKSMIVNRFSLLGKKHIDLDSWEHYFSIGKQLILDKKASLFVIYDKDLPISVSFNPVYEGIMYGYIRGFDINYAKFYLGFIDLYRQIEWCYQNGIRRMDLLRGDFDYKLRFADKQYVFRTHIFFRKNNPIALVRGTMIYVKLSFIYDIYYPMRDWAASIFLKYGYRKKNLSKKRDNLYKLQFLPHHKIQQLQMLKKIDLEDIPFKEGIRTAYHFLYTSQSSKESLQIFLDEELQNILYFVADDHCAKVILEDEKNDRE